MSILVGVKVFADTAAFSKALSERPTNSKP